jgi:glutathione S-transferase
VSPGSAFRPPVTLFGHWICPYSVRVSFALAERGIVHDLVEVPPTAVRSPGFVVPPEFVDHSPLGEIPMVRVAGEYRADSIPILDWLEERIDGRHLRPEDPVARASVRQRMLWIDTHVFPPMVGVYYGARPEGIARSAAALADALTQLGDRIDTGGWLVGDGPTLAEAVVVPLYVRLAALARLGFDHQVDDRVVAHMARCATTDGWAAVAWSDAQTDQLVERCARHRG